MLYSAEGCWFIQLKVKGKRKYLNPLVPWEPLVLNIILINDFHVCRCTETDTPVFTKQQGGVVSNHNITPQWRQTRVTPHEAGTWIGNWGHESHVVQRGPLPPSTRSYLRPGVSGLMSKLNTTPGSPLKLSPSASPRFQQMNKYACLRSASFASLNYACLRIC